MQQCCGSGRDAADAVDAESPVPGEASRVKPRGSLARERQREGEEWAPSVLLV